MGNLWLMEWFHPAHEGLVNNILIRPETNLGMRGLHGLAYGEVFDSLDPQNE